MDQLVEPVPTTTAVASAPNPSAVGVSVTFTATVTPSSATGAVTFKDGTTVLGTGTLDSSGKAVYATTALSVGGHPITATYEGDAADAASTSTLFNQTVDPVTPGSTTTVVVAAPNPSSVGESVTFTAAVTPPDATGTVTFKDGTTILGTGALTAGKATQASTVLTVGTHLVTATTTPSAEAMGTT